MMYLYTVIVVCVVAIANVVTGMNVARTVKKGKE